MASVADLKNWIGDHVTGPVLNPVLGIAGIGDQSPFAAASGQNLDTHQQTAQGVAIQAADKPSGAVIPATPGLSNWLVGFGVLTVALLLMSEGEHTSQLGVALGVVIAGTIVLKDGTQVIAEVDTLFGSNLGGKK